MNLIYRIYEFSPIWIQNIGISLYGIYLYKQRYNKTFKKYLEFYCKKDYGNYEAERDVQNQEFLEILEHTYNNSPFYKEFYKNIDLSMIKSVDDIKLLPILDKETLKRNIDNLYTIPNAKGIKSYTSGTTDEPMMVIYRKKDIPKRIAYLEAYKMQFGFVANKMKSARFFGRNIIPVNQKKKVFWRDSFFTKQRYYSTYFLRPENLPYYIENLNHFQPVAVDGFVSAIYEIAKYIIENRVVLNFTPKAVFTTAETVLPQYRRTIEEAFKCPLTDQYASNEGAPFITQCIYGNYHENIDTGVFEHIKTEGGMKLIITGFHNYGTPLIRYDIGDNIIENQTTYTTCLCGSAHPIIGGIEGRSMDFLVSIDRGNINLVNMSVLVSELKDCIEKIQFIQNDLEEILIKIIVNEKKYKPEYEQKIKNKMASRFGYNMSFKVVVVRQIEREKSGKFRMILNNIKL